MRHTHKINENIDLLNKSLKEENDYLKQEIEDAEDQLQDKRKYLNDIQNSILNQKTLSQQAFESYCDVLEKNYQEKEKEYDIYEQNLNTAYYHK